MPVAEDPLGQRRHAACPAWSLNELAAHGTHAVAPTESWKEPPAQSRQAVEPVDDAYLPVWQSVHEAKLSGSADCAIESGENDPAGQAAHDGAAADPEKVPGAQTEHAD